MSREAFEKAMAHPFMSIQDIARNWNGSAYESDFLQGAWTGWQAALESQQEQCPYIETSGMTSWCRLAAQPQVPEGYQLIDNETLRGLASVLGNDFPDCIDNDGQPYQSQYLADLITASQEQPK